MPEIGSGEIRNYDCAFLIGKIDRVLKEVVDSQSSGLNDMTAADKNRMNSYILDCSLWLDHSSVQPALDKPHSHPMKIAVADKPVDLQPDIDNEGIKALVWELQTFRINVQGCQSADLGNNYNAQDLERFRSYVSKLQSLLSDYIGQVQSLDLPESSVPGK